MAVWKIVTLICATFVIVNAKWLQKRDTKSNICDPVYNNTMKVQCYCTKDSKRSEKIRYAECYLTVATVAIEDRTWEGFKNLKHVQKLTFTNTRGIPLTYVPTSALKEANNIKKLEIKYAVINTIFPFAFANISYLEELVLRDNQIVTLEGYAFAHHRELVTISLDTNNLLEINRNVFVDLPALQKLYLTNNQISTIHDKAFVHLENLKELEIDRNKVFSLNFATFEGLKNLERLDLSSNSLEVIGDNTFSALVNLKVLNLEGNNIEMLDEKAFNGLENLLSLSLARNKLKEIQNEKVFENLKSLTSLSLRGNQILELKPSVMEPILSNFYGNSSSLDVDENNFPCDCSLDWFMILMNKTLNKHLKIALENFKCMPDAALKEAWTKTSESEKVNPQIFEDDDPQAQGNEYEYYDDTQLNGKLFYLDVRYLLKCNKDLKLTVTETTLLTKAPTSPETTTKEATNLDLSFYDTATYTKKPTNPDLSYVDTSTYTKKTTNQDLSYVDTNPYTRKTTNLDLSLVDSTTNTKKTTNLDLSLVDSTTNTKKTTNLDLSLVDTTTHTNIIKTDKNKRDERRDFTTTRLATVSAKPTDAKIYDNMASDEAKPENKIKAHRSIQDEKKPSNGVDRNLSSVVMTALFIFHRLVF